MSDSEISGNRWESDDDPTVENPTVESSGIPESPTSTTDTTEPTETTGAVGAVEPAPETASKSTRLGAAMRKPRSVAAAAAVAVALAGVSGFAAGRSTADGATVPASAGVERTGQASEDGSGPAARENGSRGPRGARPEGIVPDATGPDTAGGADVGESSTT